MAERIAPSIVAHLSAALDTGTVSIGRDGMSLRAPAAGHPQLAQRPLDDSVATEEGAGVGAGLDDRVVGLPDSQQDAVRLNRAREMNLFALAIRKK